jgi:hypothetical protein
MGLSEYQRRVTQAEFRQELQNAWRGGRAREAWASQAGWAPYSDTFDEWFEKHYGDILVVGDISPGDEKTGTTEQSGPMYFGPQYF